MSAQSSQPPRQVLQEPQRGQQRTEAEAENPFPASQTRTSSSPFSSGRRKAALGEASPSRLEPLPAMASPSAGTEQPPGESSGCPSPGWEPSGSGLKPSQGTPHQASKTPPFSWLGRDLKGGRPRTHLSCPLQLLCNPSGCSRKLAKGHKGYNGHTWLGGWAGASGPVGGPPNGPVSGLACFTDWAPAGHSRQEGRISSVSLPGTHTEGAIRNREHQLHHPMAHPSCLCCHCRRQSTLSGVPCWEGRGLMYSRETEGSR